VWCTFPDVTNRPNRSNRARGPQGLVVPVRGEHVRELRIRAGLTQREVAESAGVSDRTVSAIEMGRRSASIPVLNRLARALGVDPTALRPPIDAAA
jgi:transcriptional regulator with XRE-family HTH domain